MPCTVDTALRHIRALSDDVDLVDLYVRAATAACEDYTGRIFNTQRFKAVLPAWPSCGRGTGIAGPSERAGGQYAIVLPRAPLQTIVSLKYWPDGGGAQVTWDAANYAADSSALPGRLVVSDGVDLPALARRHDALEIEFDAGHGTTESAMPPNYLVAMLQLARYWFDNPSAVGLEGTARVMPLSFKHLLRSQKI